LQVWDPEFKSQYHQKSSNHTITWSFWWPVPFWAFSGLHTRSHH
jgi:hypothetical protein